MKGADNAPMSVAATAEIMLGPTGSKDTRGPPLEKKSDLKNETK